MVESKEEKKEIKREFNPLVFISHDTRDAELAEAFSHLLKSVSAGVLKSFEVTTESILEKMQEIKVPKGFQREIVIVGDSVFSVEKSYNKLFKRDILRLEPMDDLPPGIFPASEYQTRLFIAEGRVLFVELLSEVITSERDEFISDMRSSLKDLTRLGI